MLLPTAEYIAATVAAVIGLFLQATKAILNV